MMNAIIDMHILFEWNDFIFNELYHAHAHEHGTIVEQMFLAIISTFENVKNESFNAKLWLTDWTGQLYIKLLRCYTEAKIFKFKITPL